MSGDDADADDRPDETSEPPEQTDVGANATESDADGSAAADGVEDVPLSELARRVSESRESRTDEGVSADRAGPDFGGDTVGAGDESGADSRGTAPSGDAATDDPFEEMSVGEIDEDTLWSSLETDDDAESQVGHGESARSVAEPKASTGSHSQATEHVVSKAEYCQKCPYLDDPPALACTHEGTEIVTVVDSDHFRVRGCPMVDGREQ
ncbi:hypothetical protein DVK02_05350 [Halobellus sp. Atlit-31R]|nr:hypothetical protein DVK02_05350 [Halobellus sp. Atlit-31R]